MVYRIAALALLLLFIVAPFATAVLAVAPEIPWTVLCAGFIAQLVDGSLGMGYGITSATVLTSCSGLSPTMASSAVHLAQLGTTALSGWSHRSMGNVDDAVLRKLTPAGVAGALLGSTLLSRTPLAYSKLVSGSLLLLVGAYVVRKNLKSGAAAGAAASTPSARFLAPLGLVGGVVDAMGGGGWGPVATSGLLAAGGLAPSSVVGTVSASEFFVTVSAVLGFALVLGPTHAFAGARTDALVLLLGGLLAAPIAPLLVHQLPPRRLGLLVGCFIFATNARVVVRAAATML